MPIENLKFLLLDNTYEVVGKEPWIILWCKNEKGEPIVIIDRSFRPYFYVLPEQGSEERIGELIKRIYGLSKPRSPIISVDIVEKKYFGKPVKALKVTTVIPEAVREYREEVKELPYVKEVLEADVRFSLRYLIDKDLKPFRWYTADVEEANLPGYRVSKTYFLVGNLKEVPGTVTLRDLSLMAIDIEVYNAYGTPNPSRDPVIIIGVIDKDEAVQFVSQDKNDKDLIIKFIEYIRSKDPDIIVGYNSNQFDWPYLVQRSSMHGIVLDIGRRVNSPPTTSVLGHISIPGRLSLDIYNFAEEVPEIKMKTLDEVADYFGVMKKSERTNLDWFMIPKLWDEGGESRRKVLKYNLDDVKSTYGLAEKFLPYGIQLTSLTGIPLDQIMAASVGFRLEFYLMRQAYKHNELVPNRIEREAEPYKGAIVLTPKPGVHENVAVLDFTSMYPSIMIKYNVGPDTLIREPTESAKVNIAPDVGHRFRAEPPGFFKSVLESLLKARRAIREQMKSIPKDTPEYEVLDARQKAMKVLANAAYGYMGWAAARWYCRECAEAVTAWGRHTILRAIQKAKELGLEVIYGDTDSLFTSYDQDKIGKLIEWIDKELGFEVKIDKIYRRVFFTEAKKRYAGLTIDGSIDMVGFEAVRGDWTDIAKEVQVNVAKIVLMEGSVGKAIEYVKDLIKLLREGKVELEKLVIWKTITKNLNEYEVEAPHVKVAKRYMKAGIKIGPGDKVGYVIVKGTGGIGDRAVPYFEASIDKIDVDYYVDHQIIPAALRILSYFGVSEQTLKGVSAGGQKTLADFFKPKR
ncbi:MAG: DNA polymerase II [Desulfurococcales archaeon]|jgi:DNA polymerase I|nr:DNA polymerase II [Desulfurococcales archaeon]